MITNYKYSDICHLQMSDFANKSKSNTNTITVSQERCAANKASGGKPQQ